MYIDVSFDEVIDNADPWDVEQFVKDYIRNSEPEWVLEVASWAILSDFPDVALLLEDPAKRLEIITALRKEGYLVEPPE